MMSNGASNRRIALDMGLSESTVKIHVRAILSTLQVSNRTEAVLKAKHYLDRQKSPTISGAQILSYPQVLNNANDN